jgi:hypothetical protein
MRFKPIKGKIAILLLCKNQLMSKVMLLAK